MESGLRNMNYFISDTHYHHKNICRGTSEWPVEEGNTFPRPFNTLDEMDDAIVRNINSVVAQDDTLYHLGDWSLGGIHQILLFRQRLNCQNLHLIMGNHDDNIRYNKKIADVDPVSGFTVQLSVKELFTSVQELLEIRVSKHQKVILSHYPMRVWHDCHKGSIMLHGHSHGNLPPMDHKSMDVGIDTHPEFRPYSVDEILERMNNKPANLIESHRG